MAKDYYDILAVSKSASPDEIKKAFRKLAHEYHPDKAGGDEKKFKEINEAYQVLSNLEKRQQYDQFGTTFEQAQRQGGFTGFNGFRDFSNFADAFRSGGGQQFEFDLGDFGDIFEDLGGMFGFGSQRKARRAGARRGSDIEVNINLDFQQAVFGAEKIIELNKEVGCSNCGGSGAEPGSELIECPTCRGRGQVAQNIGFGINLAATCPACGGAGQRQAKLCSQCRGQGRLKEMRKIKVKIPAGIASGQAIRLASEGQAGVRGGPAGDLYVRVQVLSDDNFERQGDDLLVKLPISFTQAALGAKIEIQTLDGAVRLKIPEGTQTGKVFRLRGHGVPHLHSSGRGDLLVEVVVQTPTRLSRRQKEILRELEE